MLKITVLLKKAFCDHCAADNSKTRFRFQGELLCQNVLRFFLSGVVDTLFHATLSGTCIFCAHFLYINFDINNLVFI